MPRIRTLKPEFWQDSRMARMPSLERLVFLCAISMADDEGRLEGDALTVWRFGSFREDSREIARVLQALAGIGRIVLYEVGGNPYIQVVNFAKHQKIDHKSKSKLPAPSMACDLLGEASRGLDESSRILAPDQGSGIRDQGSVNPLVGLKPDDAPQAKKNAELRVKAREVIAFLNERAGKNFDCNGVNADHVVARLRDGETVEDCHAVIALKVREWSGDADMAKYLRPETLFNRKKFASYKGALAVDA